MVSNSILDLYMLFNMLLCVVTLSDRTDTGFPNLTEPGKLFWGTGVPWNTLEEIALL